MWLAGRRVLSLQRISSNAELIFTRCLLSFFVLINYGQLIQENFFGITTIYVRTDSHYKNYNIRFQLNCQWALLIEFFCLLIQEKLFGIATIYVRTDFHYRDYSIRFQLNCQWVLLIRHLVKMT
jgi:hypothetical protein